ncbi:uncharacterized protein ACBT44_006741 [Syngnathus typhle]
MPFWKGATWPRRVVVADFNNCSENILQLGCGGRWILTRPGEHERWAQLEKIRHPARQSQANTAPPTADTSPKHWHLALLRPPALCSNPFADRASIIMTGSFDGLNSAAYRPLVEVCFNRYYDDRMRHPDVFVFPPKMCPIRSLQRGAESSMLRDNDWSRLTLCQLCESRSKKQLDSPSTTPCSPSLIGQGFFPPGFLPATAAMPWVS